MSEKDLQCQIIWQDDDLAVINKPAGIVVNNADTVSEPTIQDWWQAQLAKSAVKTVPENWQKLLPADSEPQFGTPEQIWHLRQGIVHRLDKDTSGLLVLAKNPGALINLLAQFRTRQISKTYQCLTHGKWGILADEVSLPMARASHSHIKFAVDTDGRSAQTAYQVLQFYPGFTLPVQQQLRGQIKAEAPLRHLRKTFDHLINQSEGFSLVACQPKTGRTHQIRVHMAHLKHPIVADATYLGERRLKLDSLWCPRLFLHAAEITLTHPRTGKRHEFKSDLPTDLVGALEKLAKAGE